MRHRRPSLLPAILPLILLIGAGTWVFRLLENWSWAESFYFSVATLTTVGYGDIHPTTDTSRLFTAVYILAGVGVVFASLTSIGSRYLSTQENQISDSIAKRLRRRKHKKP